MIATLARLSAMNLQRPFESSRVPRPPIAPKADDWRVFEHLDLEIGAGSGMFAEQYCRMNPERALVSLERTLLRSRALLGRSDSLPNLFAYRADAVNFVSHFIDDASLSRIFILYPNPYHKAKHANLRWFNMPFMGHLLSKLRSGGELTLATNILSYREGALRAMVEHWDLRLVVSEAFVGAPRTLFEKKYLARGEPCWNMVFAKR
jgi:tRNA (guanine-N7-)-methyltransferase